ncbi:MAG: amidohydrolase [Gammaproteobacteria bacterium]
MSLIFKRTQLVIATLTLLVAGCGNSEGGAGQNVPKADLVLLDGYVYTVDQERSLAEAVAIRDGEIIFVGDSTSARELVGPETRVEDLAGRMVLPGLHDVHLHMFGIVDPDICTLGSEPVNLAELAERVETCLQRYETPVGEWLTVDAWNFGVGNQPAGGLDTLRSALDAASTEHPIILWGNDGHHGAVNSAALALARDKAGTRIGLDARTLRSEFTDYVDLVAADTDGEPTGGLHEQARFLVYPASRRESTARGPLLPQVGKELASLGLTSIQDASLESDYLPYVEDFAESGQMKFRLLIATRLDPINYTNADDGIVDIDRMMNELDRYRKRFRGVPLVAADAAKIYADGVLEGDPFATPPTLPNGAMLKSYHQPRFAYDEAIDGVRTVAYVDTGSEICIEARDRMSAGGSLAYETTFAEQHGYHPRQCRISNGVFRDTEAFIHEYVSRLNDADFTIHLHAIGDRAARVAADALEPVMEGTSGNPLRHTLAHLQVVHPDDQLRIGKLGLYLAITHAWVGPDRPYDMTVIPFIERVDGDADLYNPDSYYMQNVYPARSLMKAGAVLVGASDAPVDDLSPRPFFNIALGVSRVNEEGQALNASEAVDIHEMIAAYTINGARAMSQEDLVGSIEVGKRADIVVLDRNIVADYENGQIGDILKTQVDMTLFDGEVIHRRTN